MKLDGQRAFITGAASGLGAEIALLYAANGARVYVSDINEDAAASVAARCCELTPGSVSGLCDVSDSSSVKAAFASLLTELGGIDILVNNAGIIHTDPEYLEANATAMQAQIEESMQGQGIKTHLRSIELLSDEMFDRMMRVHMYGTFYCCREALPLMREQGGGRIINMGSLMGAASLTGAPDYCAAKGAIMAFTRATAREGASYGVRANAIAPGFIETPLLDPVDRTTLDMIAMQTPMQRLGTASEVATTALFLASDDSSFFTGQVLAPNGGIYMSQ